MTNRVNAFIVVLEDNVREDDIQETRLALQMIKGVVDVKPNIATVDNLIAETRVKREILNKILDFLKDE